MQIQADLGGFIVERPEMRESTALGSALLAGSALGLFGWDLTKPETLRKVRLPSLYILPTLLNADLFSTHLPSLFPSSRSSLRTFSPILLRPNSLHPKVNARAMATFRPKLPEKEREKKWRGWKRAVERAKKWREADEEDAAELEEEKEERLQSFSVPEGGEEKAKEVEGVKEEKKAEKDKEKKEEKADEVKERLVPSENGNGTWHGQKIEPNGKEEK
jgi:glycerol kinase